MPNYTFQDNKTGETFNLTLSLSEREAYLTNNPHVEQLIVSAPSIGDPTRFGRKTKPDNAFRDVLRSIKKKHRGSTIDTF